LYREGFPEGTQGVGFFENEHGMLLEGTFSIAKDIQAELRFRMRLSPFETESLDTFGRTRTLSGIQRTRKIRVSIIAGRKTAISWISRIELSRANANGTTDPGIMLAQEFRYTPSRDLRIQVKVTLFAVDAYDARIYSFEPTVPGMFVNRALQGEGTRSALSVLYRVRSGFEISTSFSTEVQDGRRSVGSGLEEIRGDAQSRLTIQIDLRF
jgi:hypothetical protein